MLEDVEVRCASGLCRTRVAARACGSSDTICADGQLCVGFQTSGGMPEYECVENPCLGQDLDCECAAAVCQTHTDQSRTCAVERVTDYDVYCKSVRT